ncbi:M23 family metallopeptidase [Brucepastera parasyntrophica]|uniref:M23 family metallopeptidase n=1 Tax=Brucepastera parasyntrophica TaxID=2880008 RepID=UPI00210E9FB4|nr:M23 family metallopeptidase [Brucepastera parasyntrophica]ULQ58696.1 M23 family metallopeptidase [Brucepastera parasyntrophica]
MVVPHSQKKVINFQASVFSLLFFIVLLAGGISAFFWFSRRVIVSNQEVASLQKELRETVATLNKLQDETGNLLKAAQNFQPALSGTLGLLGIDTSSGTTQSNTQGGDLASLFNIKETAFGTMQEIAELQRLAGYLENSVQPIEEIGKLLNSQNALFSDIPSLWPIKGGIGHISMAFGQNKHPFTGQWYIHKGVDLSTYRSGDSVLATADGTIATVAYDPSFGNYVIIRHKHGFYTRYAHLQRAAAQKGDYVRQGDVIGYIGNTGISTGPHLHYEIHVGSDVVDPMKYINVKSINK